MNLLHVVASMDPKTGGVCQAVRTIIAGLAATGVASEVVSLDMPSASFLAQDSFPVHALGPSRGPWAYSPELSSWLTINLPRFECVILHGLWLYPNYAVHRALHRLAAAGEPTSPRLFVMPHGMLDPYFQREAGRRLKALRNWVYWKIIEARVVNSATAVLFTCEEECRLAREPFRPYHPRQELIVGLGVAEPPAYTPAMREAFRQACPGVAEGKYLLFLSRLHEKKGVDLLISAYQTESALPSPADTKLPGLVVAGPGLDTPYGHTIQQQINVRSHAITLAPMLTGDAKWGAFYGCAAFILPSHQENFGIAVVEALACAKPVLISSKINIWREIKAGGGGLIANDTLAGCRELLKQWNSLSAPAHQPLQASARATYQAHFAVPAATNKLLRALTCTTVTSAVADLRPTIHSQVT
jgi:glycosyltransferase involved in cell wall biosynthesis